MSMKFAYLKFFNKLQSVDDTLMLHWFLLQNQDNGTETNNIKTW